MSADGLARRFVDPLAAITDLGSADTAGQRLRVTTPEGPHLAQQQACCWADDRNHHLCVVCSGLRPVGPAIADH